jgi:RNA polymerase sigma factor (sigma-70 family)
MGPQGKEGALMLMGEQTPPASSSFESVYEAELPAISRLAFLLTRSREVAEELAHDAFVKLYEAFDAVEQPAGWLRTTVVRLAINWQRRQAIERRNLARGPDPSAPLGEPALDETWEALGRLRSDRQVVLVLRFYEDLSHRDIARLLGCPTATVRSRTRRALNDLRREVTR